MKFIVATVGGFHRFSLLQGETKMDAIAYCRNRFRERWVLLTAEWRFVTWGEGGEG